MDALRFFFPLPPDRALGAHWQARALTAAALDATNGPGLSAEAVQDILWTDRSGLNPWRFSAMDHGAKLCLTALGRRAVGQLVEWSVPLGAALGRYVGRDATVRLEALPVSVELAAPHRWTIPSLVLHRGRRHFEGSELQRAIRENDGEALGRLALDVVRAGLNAQADLLGIELPPADEWTLARAEVSNLRGVPVGLGQPHEERSPRSLLAARVECLSTLRLRGPWAVGALASRGHGIIHAIQASRPPRAPQAAQAALVSNA